MLDIRELLNLKEAYAEVYASQELTEEQVWEGVEEWVNALLEEGYDLSDYTWEEMYESYLEEIYGTGLGGNTKTKPNRLDTAVGNAAKSVSNFGKSDPTPRTTGIYGQPTRTTVPAATSASRPPSRFAGARDAAFAKAQNIKGSPVVGSKPAASPPAASPAASRPAASAPARPTATAAAPKPAATAPAAKPAGSAMDQFAKANPGLAASAAERARTRGTSATTNPLMKDMKSRLPAPKTPSPTTAKTGFDLAKKGVNLAAGFDMFDVVKGYLIDEGYADTEEAALAIMINMSEEWRQSIVEGDNYDKNRQRAAKRAAERNAARDAGKTGNVPGVGYVTPRKERETYRDAAGVERHTSGAKMPK